MCLEVWGGALFFLKNFPPDVEEFDSFTVSALTQTLTRSERAGV